MSNLLSYYPQKIWSIRTRQGEISSSQKSRVVLQQASLSEQTKETACPLWYFLIEGQRHRYRTVCFSGDKQACLKGTGTTWCLLMFKSGKVYLFSHSRKSPGPGSKIQGERTSNSCPSSTLEWCVHWRMGCDCDDTQKSTGHLHTQKLRAQCEHSTLLT